jgi:hypothetical protein
VHQQLLQPARQCLQAKVTEFQQVLSVLQHAVLLSYRCVQLMALDQQLDMQRATELRHQVQETQSPPVMQRQQPQPLEPQQLLEDAKSSPVVALAISSLQELARNSCENTASVPAAPLEVTSPPSQGRYSFGDARATSPISPVSVSPRMYEPIFSVFFVLCVLNIHPPLLAVKQQCLWRKPRPCPPANLVLVRSLKSSLRGVDRNRKSLWKIIL